MRATVKIVMILAALVTLMKLILLIDANGEFVSSPLPAYTRFMQFEESQIWEGKSDWGGKVSLGIEWVGFRLGSKVRLEREHESETVEGKSDSGEESDYGGKVRLAGSQSGGK